MNEEQISKIELSIKNLKEKKSRIYFLVQDTKGNAKASISYIYKLAMTLKNEGYNSIILHEKPDYTGVSTWMDEKYMSELPHKSIEGQNLEVSPEDFIIVPELYGFVMSQLTKLPCGKIVLSQAYDHVLETLQPGVTWSQLGFLKCITTSEFQKEHLESIMKGVSFDVLPPVISNLFEKQTFPAKPIISIHSREQRDAINVIKTFYIKFPQYRWITFRDMRNLSEKDFANALKDSFLSVWIDETSGYGTFPLESMKSGIPVMGIVPNLLPHWMNEQNGLWLNNKNQLPDYIADFLQNWLEDNIKPTLTEEMQKTVENLPTEENFKTLAISLFDKYITTRTTSFEEQLNKLKTSEE
jgi:hypothetical protein